MGAPRRSAGARTRGAGRAAARALPANRQAGEPCATCPQGQMAADLEKDGALIGANCSPLSDPRERGQLRPRQVLDHIEPGAPDGLGGSTPPVPVYKDDPRDAGRRRQGVTKADVNNARANAVLPDSQCCAKQQAAHGGGAPQRTIVYVNGINTTKKDHCETLRRIANSTCARVIGVYNATEGMGTDLVQVTRDRSLIKDAAKGRAFAVGDRRNPAVDTMADVIVEEVQEGQHVELWAHSQGGAIASLSLFDAERRLTRGGVEAPLRNIEVNSFASAAPIWPTGPTYTHYIHTGDFVPVRTGLGTTGITPHEAGDGAHLVFFNEEGAGQGRRFNWDEDTVPGSPQPSFHAIVPRPWLQAATANHSIDDKYLDLYRQRRREKREPVCDEGTK